LEIDEQSKEYWRWRDTILYNEELLMEQLCFDFEVMHPYDYLVGLVKRFASGNSVLGKCAWAFINDRCGCLPLSLVVVVGLCFETYCSLRTPMQVMYPAHVIAASSFYFARKHTQTIIPQSPEGKEWYEEYHVRLEDLRGTKYLKPNLLQTKSNNLGRCRHDDGGDIPNSPTPKVPWKIPVPYRLSHLPQ
jgi:protein BUR2